MTNKIILLLSICAAFASCTGQEQRPSWAGLNPILSKHVGDTVSALGKNIDCIFQDKNNNYWFASNGEGAYRYDGKTLIQFTSKNGLCSDFVLSIAEDKHGDLWFSTRDGICRYNGLSFLSYTDKIVNAPVGKLQPTEGGLFFNHSNGVCYYDGTSFTNFVIQPEDYTPPSHSNNRPYSVYSTWVDQSNNVWFGTQEKGVCVYDGRGFSFVTGKDLDGPAVRAIFQDKKGVYWFGNNGGGLFKYDGVVLTNITEENNLGNYQFLKEQKPVDKPGSLARVFAINEDSEGNLWIGTVDAGVWKYDGVKLTNYTMKDGLSSNCVYGIYKDRKGKLWFVSNGEQIVHFDGQRFTQAKL